MEREICPIWAERKCNLNPRLLYTDRWLGDVFRDFSHIPKSGEFQSARAVAVGLFDVEQQTLQHLRFFVGVKDFKFGITQLRSLDDRHPPIDSDCRVVPRD